MLNKTLENAQDVFLEKINQLCREFGLNNIMAQLYAVLYLSDKPLSLDDMLERLKISKGSVSVNIRNLERYGVARKVWVKGSRKDYYEAELDIYKVIMDRISSMGKRRLADFENMINSSYEAIDSVNLDIPEEKETIEIFKKRLENLKKLHSKVKTIFNLFNSGILKSLLSSKKKEKAQKYKTLTI